jgi:hypothetical protein
MNRTVGPPRRKVPLIVWIAFLLVGFVLLFLIENLWIDSWLRNKSHRMPSLIPVQQSGIWFLAFAIAAVAVVFILICLVLLVKDRGAPAWTKLGVSFALIAVCLLGAEWVRVTNGQTSLLQLLHKPHQVVLHWKPSSSAVIGYNVYRKAGNNADFVKLNSGTISGLTYTDDAVESGITYEYVTRSVDASGRESGDSNAVTLHVP